jgi:hypothetical protein
MWMFDVQGIEITAPRRKAFEFLREPVNLPRWAHAFVSAGNGRARLETPAGAVDVGLEVTADAQTGVVDWRLAFPDGSVGIAQSRVTETTRRRQLHPRCEEEPRRAHAAGLSAAHRERRLDSE